MTTVHGKAINALSHCSIFFYLLVALRMRETVVGTSSYSERRTARNLFIANQKRRELAGLGRGMQDGSAQASVYIKTVDDMENDEGKRRPIVIKDHEDQQAEENVNESFKGSKLSLKVGDEVRIVTEPVKKKKVRGLHLPVRAFKSREDRDPDRVNKELKVGFDDVINEPEGFYTPKFSWHISHELYGFGRACCYSVTTLFCGIPLALLWGIIFAFLACINVWIFAPCRRGLIINLSCISGFWSSCISTFFDPFYRSFGLIFSNLSVRTEKFVV